MTPGVPCPLPTPPRPPALRRAFDSPAFIGSDGKASVTATANGTAGTYTVIGSATGIASPVNFSLANTAPAALLASAQTPQQISDRTWAELGQSWDLLLAGSNVQMLTFPAA